MTRTDFIDHRNAKTRQEMTPDDAHLQPGTLPNPLKCDAPSVEAGGL